MHHDRLPWGSDMGHAIDQDNCPKWTALLCIFVVFDDSEDCLRLCVRNGVCVLLFDICPFPSQQQKIDGWPCTSSLPLFPNRFEHAIYGQHTFTRIAPGRVNGNCITRILNWKARIDLHTYWLLIPKSNNQQAKGWDSDLPSMRICLARKTESPSKIYLEKKGTRVKCARYRLFRRRVWAMNSSYDYKGMGDSEPHVCLSLCPTRLLTWSGRAGSSSVNKCRRNNC